MLESIAGCFFLAVLSPWGHRLAPRASGWAYGLLAGGITAWIARAGLQLPSNGSIRTAYAWFPTLGVSFSFHLDGLSLIFGLLIAGIGAVVIVYAGGYMAGDARLGRLYALLAAFMGSMLGVVFADNVLTLFVFWELTSITSFLLIGTNHEEPTARSAALQALLVTGGGGLALLAGLILLGMIGGSYELSELRAAVAAGSLRPAAHALYVPALLLILLGAFTKSAQFPFHFWLPNAMAAPTPVSAYLHSATMVKAGVYLLARLAPTLGDSGLWYWGVSGVGAITFVGGAALALGQHDLKLILAYTTVSVLGALTLLIGLGTEAAAVAAILLLTAHALYKAVLFLVAGAIDHATGTRDVRRLRGLRRAMPITAFAAVLATASGIGLPVLYGFIAKESFYEALRAGPAGAVVLIVLGVLGNILLMVGTLIAGWVPFSGAAPHADDDTQHAGESQAPHEAPVSMWLGPVLLAIGGVVLGVAPALMDAVAGGGASAIAGAVIDTHFALWHGFNLVLVLSALTLIGGFSLYAYRGALLDRAERLRALGRWGPDRAYAAGLEGLNRLARFQTGILQSGYLRLYLTTIIVMTAVLGGYALFSGTTPLSFPSFDGITAYEAALMLLILCGTVMVVRTDSRLAAVFGLATVGYGVTLIFVLHAAPDLAMTQFAIETLTVILFVLILYRLPRFSRLTSRGAHLRDIALSLGAGAFMTVVLLAATSVPLRSRLSGYFAEASLPEGKGRNIVNVILVDFRAMDTLGEITVLSVAAIGVAALIRAPGKRVAGPEHLDERA